MATTKKSNQTKKTANSSAKTGKKGEKTAKKNQKKKVDVRVVEEPSLDLPKDLGKTKKRVTKDDVRPKKDPIFHVENEKSVDKSSKNKVKKESKDKKNISKQPHPLQQEKQGGAVKPPQSFNLYRKIAISFIVLTLLLVGVVFYFSFNKVVITLFPKEERVSDQLILDVYDGKSNINSTSSKDIEGVVLEKRLGIEKTYPTSGTKSVGGKIEGTVTIINNRSEPQTLVRTTRLLSPNDKLFRIDKRVEVPAGGEKEVAIYTDDPGPDMAIEPTEFTIPGLWAGLRDKVYAENKEAFTYNMGVERFAEKEDIERATEDIKHSLKKRAEDKFTGEYENKDELIFELDENSIVMDIPIEAGEKAEEFTAGATATVNVIAFDTEKVQDLAKKKLELMVPSEKKLVSFNKNNIGYSLDGVYSDKNRATVNASFNGKMMVKKDADVIDRSKIVGLDKSQLEAHLDTLDQFSGYKIFFSPSFMKKVPSLEDEDRIQVEIKY